MSTGCGIVAGQVIAGALVVFVLLLPIGAELGTRAASDAAGGADA